MSKRYDLAVVIGRFQPFHDGHLNLINKAREIADRVLICIGSSGISRNIKNPFTYVERVDMIISVFPGIIPVYHMPIRDSLYNDQLWVRQVQSAIAEASRPDEKVVVVGHKKDHTTFYLDMFKPAYDYHEVTDIVPIDATTIRNQFFRQKGSLMGFPMPFSVVEWLIQWQIKNPDIYKSLCEEARFIYDYKKQWTNAPFQPVFTTTDAVVICSGHILLVKRRHEPGKGLWALPGGFLGNNEFIKDSMLRELKEETRIKVDDTTILASIKANRVFDAPGRSERGRTITHAYLINLGWGPLPKVRGSDDAERAKWFPLNHFFNKMGDQMYEDHYDIGTTLINA